MFTDSVVHPGVFVDVVAQMQHQIQILFGHMIVSCEVAAFKMLARRESELQFLRHDAHGWHCASLTDPTHCITRLKAIPVPRVWLQAREFNVDRMPQLRRGQFCARLRDLLKSFVCRDFPFHFVAFRLHSATVDRINRQTRPQHNSIAGGISRGNSQLKRILREGRPTDDGSLDESSQPWQSGQRGSGQHHVSSRHCQIVQMALGVHGD